MEMRFIGTGNAFSMKNYQTNFVLSSGDKNLLVDCGSDIRFSLEKQSLTPMNIDAIYVSHAHADHIGGLEYMAFSTYWSKHRIKLYVHESWAEELWTESLRGGLKGIEGKRMHLSDYFDVILLKDNEEWEWQSIKFNCVQTLHIFAQYSQIDSYGLMFNPVGGPRVYLTTDCQFAPETSQRAFYREAELIVHDCETAKFASGVHSHYDQLRTLPAELKAKMLLVHYQDNVVENWDEWQGRALADGFLGFVKQGKIWSDRYGLQP